MSYHPLRLVDWRTPGDIRAELQNVLVNPAGDDERGPSVVGMPGCTLFATLPNGARGLHCEPGILAGNLLTVGGNDLYQITSAGVVTSLGGVGGTGPARMAATEAGIIVSSSGATSFRANTGTITPVTLPNGDLILDAASIDQRGLYVGSGTARVWWSEVGAPQTVLTANFASAVTRSDQLVGLRVVDRNVYLLGQTSIELWRPTGAVSPAIRRVGDLAFDKGVAGRDAACGGAGRLWFLSPDGVVWSLVGQQPERVSTPSMDTEIGATSGANRAAANLHAWTWSGRELLTLHVPNLAAWTYDIAAQLWSRRTAPGVTGERWTMRVAAFGGIYAASQGAFQVAALTDSTPNELAVGASVRRWTVYTPAPEATPIGLFLPDVELTGGAGSMVVDYSQDGGKTYVGARTVPLPAPLMRQLGLARRPGRVWRFTVSDGALFSARGCRINERARGV